jgi:hypothetical protein
LEDIMTSEAIRDPLKDHLLTPQNAALIIIDYQGVDEVTRFVGPGRDHDPARAHVPARIHGRSPRVIKGGAGARQDHPDRSLT